MSRILIVRGDGIGDALALTPLVAALRAAGHELGAVLSTRNAGAPSDSAFASRHVLERYPWPRHGSTPESRSAALAQVRARGYDIALIPSEEPDAYSLPVEAAIPVRIGFTNGLEKPFKSLWVRRRLTSAVARPASARRERRNEVEVLFELGAGLHGEAQPTRDLARLRPLVLDEPAAPSGRVVVQLSPKYARYGLGAEEQVRAFAALAAAGPVSALGDPADLAGAREIAAAAGLTLLATPTLGAWKAAIAGARGLVTPDTGAAHVAGMTGVPAFVLFEADGAAEANVRRWRPWCSQPCVTLPATRESLAGLERHLAEWLAALGTVAA
jgi:ADP-heptose:LPS heptosyltransferase